MNQIIIRDIILGQGYINSSFINLCHEKIFNSEDDLLAEFGIKMVMEELFKENMTCDCLEDTSLYKAYKEVLQSGKDNEYFKVVYKIDDEFVVHLSQNIYLYHLPKTDEVYSNIVPWIYADSRIYLGDTWWDDDNTILHDLSHISVIEFMKKYKGY